MSSRFGDFKKYDPRGRTADYTLPIDGDPKLTMKHAGQTNKPYTNAVVKHNAKSGAFRRGRADASMLADNLNLDRDLFGFHVITGWKGVVDQEGNEVLFTPDACKEFLYALPDWIVQELSAFAARAHNFLPDDMPSEAEVADQAGN